MLAATTETEVGASGAKATKLAWEDAHATWRASTRKAARDIAAVELHHARDLTFPNARKAFDARSADLQATVDGALEAFLTAVEA